MWPFKRSSKSSKTRPADSPGSVFPGESGPLDGFPVELADLREVIRINVKDITELVTSINRIERKQNRWIELLNLKEFMKAAEAMPGDGTMANKSQALEEAIIARQPSATGEFQAGEPTEE